ncbi:MAG: hypothetical protein LBG60_14615, partial [Bifidobacteriaceae bacterium]|nr:hypothetical protein [Bifidobacteriaceae bacterium]
VYLGSASVSRDEATTVMVKIPPSFASTTGRIRLQTQGAGASPDQPESSQFSRTVALDAAATCSSAVEIDLRAWTGVPPAATTHDAIIASGADELRPGDPFTAGADVWFTYTVRNAGRSDLIDVAVRDTQAGEVCVIPRIAPNATAGCARRAGPA